MEDKVIEILQTFGYPVLRQGSLSEDEDYPQTFYTFWNIDSPDHAHYDNEDYGTAWAYQIAVYSSEPATAYKALKDAITAFKGNGWVVPSKGYDVASDEPTHIGRATEIYYLEV